MKKKISRESTIPLTPPIRASQITTTKVELTPPTSNGAQVEENVTHENAVDIQRYLRWADQAIKRQGPHKQSRKGALAKAG